MTMDNVAANGLVLLGCGKMGSAMLQGWLNDGLPAASVWVLDPYPSDWLKATGVHINTELPGAPAIVLIAVKPQMMGEALPVLKGLGNGATLFVSVAAGTTIAQYEDVLGDKTPIIRAMPNTPAAVGKGITAIVGNAQATGAQMDLAEALLSAVGQVVRLDGEAQMDAVTGVSGSGPAYVFHMIEAMAAAETPAQLRVNVTSPNGTTQAGLEVLMDKETGLPMLMSRTVAAATRRSKELANG